jgi:N,N'-diacetyllegionaminate synthase
MTFIAEFCQNHNGDREVLKDMIWAAAEGGADYAKVQTILPEELTFRERFEEGVVEDGRTVAIRRPYEPEYARLKGLTFPESEYGWFADECARAGIKPLTTVFTQARVESVAAWGWPAVKVASYDCASYPLLRTLRERFQHLYVSTGATRDDELERAAQVLNGASFSLLHCVTIYPTPLEDLNLRRMEHLRRYSPSVGFSDHTLVARDGIKAAAVALLLGADVIERHFTVLAPGATRDGPVSIDQGQLATLVQLSRGSKEDRASWVRDNVGDYGHMLGSAVRELTDAELLNRDYYRGRFASPLPDGRWVYNWEEMPEAAS